MDVEGEPRRYGDTAILEPILEQQDDEMTASRMSDSSIDASLIEEDRRTKEEIQQFEDLEKEFASQRHGIRVKFDDERLVPLAHTTMIKTEPHFQVNATEDQVTKHFYHNEFPLKTEENNHSYKKISMKTLSEPDSLEDEYLMVSQEDNSSCPSNDEMYQKNRDHSFSSPGKSILKKSSKKPKVSIRSLSPSSSSSTKKKQAISISPSNSNEMLHLAEVTAKVTSSQPSNLPRSLFEPTINIFDSSKPKQFYRSSRLQYYIKPYRGDVYIPPDDVKRRSRSLSEQRLAQQQQQQQQQHEGPTVWYTFSNQYKPSSYRKQHVSWSPVRDYIHQGRPSKSPIKKSKIKEPSSSLFSSFSSSSPNLRTSTSMIPISTRYTSSHLSPSSIDSYETSSMTNYSLTPLSQYDEKKETVLSSPLPDIVYSQQNKQHSETMQRYDRLLEKMRFTDEQLQSLSRSWTNTVQQRRTTIKDSTVMKSKEFISPMFLQTCLLILIIFNLLVVYFFNDINILWSRYFSHSSISNQQDDETLNF